MRLECGEHDRESGGGFTNAVLEVPASHGSASSRAIPAFVAFVALLSTFAASRSNADFANNSFSAFPSCVDAAYSVEDGEPEWGGLQSLDIQSGSLNPGRHNPTNQFNPQVRPVEDERGNWLSAIVSSTLVSPGTYAPGQLVATVRLCVFIKGVPTLVTLAVRASSSSNSPSGATYTATGS
jgi:hypothetical protein